MLEIVTIASVSSLFLTLIFLVYLEWGNISALFRKTSNASVKIPGYDLKALSANVQNERKVLLRLWEVTSGSFQVIIELKRFERALKKQENVIHRLKEIQD